MAGAIGDAFVNVQLDPRGVDQQLGALGGQLEGRFGKLGGAAGLAMKAGLVGAVAGAAITVGKELYDLGARFDAITDDMQVATGKTGKELDRLVDSSRKIATEVPASFEDAGDAIGQLHARTGLTGKGLESLAKQTLELSRLTGEDLSQVIEDSTRMFGDWGLAGADAAQGLDKVFRASQVTGVEVGRLEQLLTKFGGPARQLGFTFEELAALLGKFEQEGVNTELVMGSMRIALGKMAKAGKDPQKELRRTMQAIKETGDVGEATGMAIELFGARAGPDMAAAIREGRFEIDDLVKTIAKGRGTIVGTGKDTADLAEQWQMFKNRVLVGLAPLAERFFNVLGEGMEFAAEELPPLVDGLERDLGPVLRDLATIVEQLMPVFRVTFGVIAELIKGMIGQLEGLAKIVGGVVTIIAGLLTGDWAKAWSGAKDVVAGLVQFTTSGLEGIVRALDKLVAPLRNAARELGAAIIDGIMTPLEGAGDAVRGAINRAVTFGDELLSGLGGRARAIGQRLVAGAVDGVEAIGDAIRGAINRGITFGGELLEAIAGRALAVGARIVAGIVSGLAGVGERVVAALRAMITFGGGLAAAVAARARRIGEAIKNAVVSGITGLAGAIYDAVRDQVESALDRLRGIGGGILGRIPGNPFGRSAGAAAPPGPTGPLSRAAGLGAAAPAGSGVSGPPPPFQSLRRELGRIGAARAAVAGAPPVVAVRVFIGETELRGIVQSEVGLADDETARVLLGGLTV